MQLFCKVAHLRMAVSLEEGKELSPDVLRQLVLGQLTEPVVFHGLLQWPLLSWTWADWAERMGDSRLPFRKGRRGVTKGPQWERQCGTEHLTLREFLRAATEQGGDSWLYYDYKHMAELTRDHPAVVEAVSWASLGFPEKTGSDSTLWIGSTGAHTPCHADTYGCNLVAQIMGRQQWILFPPDTLSILPTRVPYEESSIYSQRNFYSPDPSMADELQGARVVTLGPGDVLFVPRRWWHYVENLSPAISINVWLPLEDLDDKARLEEALVRFIVSQLCKDLPAAVHSSLLNPNEEDVADTPLSVTLSQLRLCLDKCSDAGGSSRAREGRAAASTV
ncbi:HSPB1-associated protein 1 isoform X2 [Bacillus rossius redtenbacheri]|uniref:HSPB1-associated protein 1 isoform X2 n=1 Tax=Bacillus rossius redtenbacheri TaxID=93214 RepID=UPI002FDD9C2E